MYIFEISKRLPINLTSLHFSNFNHPKQSLRRWTLSLSLSRAHTKERDTWKLHAVVVIFIETPLFSAEHIFLQWLMHLPPNTDIRYVHIYKCVCARVCRIWGVSIDDWVNRLVRWRRKRRESRRSTYWRSANTTSKTPPRRPRMPAASRTTTTTITAWPPPPSPLPPSRSSGLRASGSYLPAQI